MNRTAVLLIGITLVCGLLFGWLGAIVAGQFRNAPDTAASIPGDTVIQSEPVSDPPSTMQEMATLLEPVQATGDVAEQKQGAQVVVSVNGAVRRPGVYTFAVDARVQDGIKAAGGVTDEADMGDINIAARMVDNTSLYIPFQMFRQQEDKTLVARRMPSAAQNNPARYTRSGWANGEPPGVTVTQDTPAETPVSASVPADIPTPAGNSLINLNTATLDELQELPGIGPKTAEKINAYRKTQPFRTIDDLESVSGIGPKTMDSVRALVTVD